MSLGTRKGITAERIATQRLIAAAQRQAEIRARLRAEGLARAAAALGLCRCCGRRVCGGKGGG